MQATRPRRPVRAAVFSDVDSADNAVGRLLAAGFTKEQITVICSDEAKEQHFRDFEHQHPAGAHTTEAAAKGGAIGAVIGGLSSAGMATAVGVPLLFAGPPFLVGGLVAGGFIGAMTTRGVEKEVADYYDQSLTSGKLLVAVEDEDPERLKLAEELFAESGSDSVSLTEG